MHTRQEFNERAGCWLGNHLIADHPEIKAHLATRVADSKITMISYGADRIDNADSGVLAQYGLQPGGYAMGDRTATPANSILEIVAAFSRKPRGMKLVVLGRYDPEMPYHKQVQDAASGEVLFPGAIYDKATVSALRFHSSLYNTAIRSAAPAGCCKATALVRTALRNGSKCSFTAAVNSAFLPLRALFCHRSRRFSTACHLSLVEAMGAGSAVLAHGNHFNRWVAGPGARYFEGEQQCADQFDAILSDPAEIARMRAASRERHAAMFTWERVLGEYEGLLERWRAG